MVSIDDFSRAHSSGWDGRVLSSYSLREDENHELMTDNLHFIFVELSNFKKEWEDIDNDKERLYFCLKHLHELDQLPECFAEGIWAKLADQAKVVEMEPEVKEQYIRIMETEIDKRAQLEYAREEGMAKGMAKGMAEGEAIGRAESMAEAARRMKSMGMPVETICEVTGLPIDILDTI